MTVSEWLKSLGYENVSDACVTIGRETFYGARYRDRWNQDVLYLCGNLPASYKRSSRVAYYFEDLSENYSPPDWYVASFADASVAATPEFANFHPFGATFQLRRWNHEEGGRIDHFESTPYRRIRAELT